MDSDPSESPTEPAGTAVPPSAPMPPPEPTLLPSTVAATPTPPPHTDPAPHGSGAATGTARPARTPRRNPASATISTPARRPGQRRSSARRPAPAAHHRAPRARGQLRQATDAHPAQGARPLRRFRAPRVAAPRVRRRVPRTRRVTPAPDRDRHHLHRRLVVGALPHHGVRAGAGRRPRLAAPYRPAPRRRPKANDHRQPQRFGNCHPRRHRGQARRDPRRHRHHHGGRGGSGRSPRSIILGIAIVLGAFLLGRRRGRKRSTIVEVRRI